MKKLTTLYKKDPNDLGRVIDEINPENDWVFEFGIPTRKFDGTACAVIDGFLYRRYDAKIDKETGKYKKPVPEGAIPCQEPDYETGHHPHWVCCKKNNPNDKHHFEAFGKQALLEDGTYELCGEKVQGNPEKIKGHQLIKHGSKILGLSDFTFNTIKGYFKGLDIEGIVFHHAFSEKMCKIRLSDFGLKRNK